MASDAALRPINANVLQWAREYRGFTVRQAAQALGIEDRALTTIETGSTPPSTAIFKKMAQVYRQSESVLLLPSPPRARPLPTDYRTVGGRPANPTPATVWSIREAQEIQEYMSDIAEADPSLISRANLRSESRAADPEIVAVQERLRFSVPAQTQLAWAARESFPRWRTKIQSMGILVFVLRMPWEDCRGFSLVEEGFLPSIVVNIDDIDQAKTFTLFHEYGHLMLGDAGVCVRAHDASDKGRTERWCNDFAAAFLIPQDDLREYVHRVYRTDQGRDWSINEIRNAANRYKVSRPAMALRLQTLGLAQRDFYEVNKAALEAYDRRSIREDPPKIKRRPGWKEKQRLNQVGMGVVSPILAGWQTGVVDPTEAADTLGLSLDELSNLEEYAALERVHFAGT